MTTDPQALKDKLINTVRSEAPVKQAVASSIKTTTTSKVVKKKIAVPDPKADPIEESRMSSDCRKKKKLV